MPARTLFLFVVFLVVGSVPVLTQSVNRSVKAEPFDHSEEGQLVKVYTITNANGVELRRSYALEGRTWVGSAK
jgi:hypothetical protein